MSAENPTSLVLGGTEFEVIKPARLRPGMVLKSGDVYARVGEKEATISEQIHTVSLFHRGFPVAQVLESGELPDGRWYFTEASLGTETFHQRFVKEYRENGRLDDRTYQEYLSIIERYIQAQVDSRSLSSISPEEFRESCIPDDRVLQNYCYFGHDANGYQDALDRASDKLLGCPMGVLQYDLNPYNILEKGIIDFELVGFGPIGYDALLSARWASTWFTDYPSRYPIGYRVSDSQIEQSDVLIDGIAENAGLPKPTDYLQEFLLIKSAWGCSAYIPPDESWPQDKIAFQRYRANVLQVAVTKYLAGEPIITDELSKVPGGELLTP